MTTVSKVFVVVAILAIFVRIFIVDSFIVQGDSMAPTILSGDYIFINKYAYRFENPRRGDIIVVHPKALEPIVGVVRLSHVDAVFRDFKGYLRRGFAVVHGHDENRENQDNGEQKVRGKHGIQKQ